MRLVGTNADMRKGSVTGLPVSGWMDELTTAEWWVGGGEGGDQTAGGRWQVIVTICARRIRVSTNTSYLWSKLTLLRTVKLLLLRRIDPEALLARGLDLRVERLDIRLRLLELSGRREERERRGRAVEVLEAAGWVC